MVTHLYNLSGCLVAVFATSTDAQSNREQFLVLGGLVVAAALGMALMIWHDDQPDQ